MHRIDGAGATLDNKFTQGDPATATPATTVTPVWLNDVQEEILAPILAAGITPVKGDGGQLLQALRMLNGRVVNSISELRALDKTKHTRVLVPSYYGDGAGGGGSYTYDPTDTTSADNGGSVIVAADGARWKLRWQSAYDVADFGAKCDGVTNDSPFVAAALNALGTAGGVVTIRRGAKCLIDTALTIPENCHLVGPHNFAGTPGNNLAAPYGQVGGALLVNPAVTIITDPGASIRGLLIYRKGMTFPAANASAFAGAAVTIGGDDCAVERCLVMGFNKAIYSNSYQRPRIENVWHDNVNGIEITNCLDVPYLSNCHAWPFASIAAGGAPSSLERAGIAYNIHDNVDWAKLTNCFSYGYAKGFEILNANATTLLSCGADNTFTGSPLHVGSIGLRIAGSSDGTRAIGFQASAQHQAGIAVNISAGKCAHIHSGDVWGGSTHGVLLESGDLNVIGNTFDGLTYGISVSSAASRLTRIGNRFKDVGEILNVTVQNSTIYGGDDDCVTLAAGSSIAGGNVVAASVASAASLLLPATGEMFNITGNTDFGILGGGWKDRTVTLIFSGVLSVFSSTGASYAMKLNGNATFVTAANSTLTLRHNGVQWYEIGRCV